MRAEVLLVRAAAALARIDVAAIEDDEMNCLIQLSDVIANRIAEISRARNPAPEENNDKDDEQEEEEEVDQVDEANTELDPERDVDGFLASLEAQADNANANPTYQDMPTEDANLPPSKRQRVDSTDSPAHTDYPPRP